MNIVKMKNSKLERFQALLTEVEQLASEIQDEPITDIFYNGGHIELLTACLLGHRWSNKTQGPDAYDKVGVPVEYKTINLRSGGGSFQFHWKQLDKLDETDRFYFVLRNGADIKEVYMMPVDQVKALGEDRVRISESKRPRKFDKGGFNIYIKDMADAERVI
jgi:hypothetical protein